MEFKNTKLEEFNSYIKNRQVAVIGLEINNLPLLEYLHDKEARVTIFDPKTIEEIPKEALETIKANKNKCFLGRNYLKYLKGFDLIFRAPNYLPNIPEIAEEENRGAIVTTEIELIIKMSPSKIIGITGNDEINTITNMISKTMKKSGKKYYIGGSNQKSLFGEIEKMEPEDIVLLQLNNAELMEMEVSPQISIINNMDENESNIHEDYGEYGSFEKNIFRNQNEDGILILNYDNETVREFEKEAKGKVIFFSCKEKINNGYILDEGVIKECEDGLRQHIVNTKEIKIKEISNYQNAMITLAVTKGIVDVETVISIIK